MKIFNIFCIILLIGCFLLIPNSNAAPAPAVGECELYRHQAVASIINVVSAGDNEIWASIPGCGLARSNTQVLKFAAVYNGPVYLSATPPTFAWSSTTGGPTGCTTGAFNTAGSSTAGGAESEYELDFTMTSNECRALITFSVNIVVAAVVVYQWRSVFPINIRVEQPNMFYECGANGLTQNTFNPSGSSCLNPQIDNIDRLSAASTWGATPTTPQINNLDYWCDATLAVPNSFNAGTTTCNRPTFTMNIGTGTLTLAGTVNVVNSGTQHIIIDSWPSLTAAVTNSGTINIQNTAGQTFALSGTINTALSGTLNVVNSGGQTISISSWPQLQAALSGKLDLFNYLCGATGTTSAVYNAATQVCNTPTFNVVNSGSQNIALSGTINTVNSGTQHIVIDTWPNLIAAVTNSGTQTVNIQNTAGQTFALSGTVNTPVSGTINVVNSGGQNIAITSWPQLQAVLSGKLTIYDFFCAATNTTVALHNDVSTQCIPPYFIVKQNGVLSGTTTNGSAIQHLVIDSWPNLIAAVTNSGTQTINVQNTAGQVFTLGGTVNTIESGAITVTNQGGQTLSISSWPQLQAILSGNVNIHQDQACGATISCLSTLNATFVNQGNVTSNMNTNIQLSAPAYYLLLVVIAFFAVFADWKGDALYWFIDLIFSIYLLIIRPDNSIIPRGVFLGWIFIVAYQVIALLSNKKAKNLSGDE